MDVLEKEIVRIEKPVVFAGTVMDGYVKVPEGVSGKVIIMTEEYLMKRFSQGLISRLRRRLNKTYPKIREKATTIRAADVKPASKAKSPEFVNPMIDKPRSKNPNRRGGGVKGRRMLPYWPWRYVVGKKGAISYVKEAHAMRGMKYSEIYKELFDKMTARMPDCDKSRLHKNIVSLIGFAKQTADNTEKGVSDAEGKEAEKRNE